MAAYRLGVQNGRPIVLELRVFPDEPDRPWAGEWSGEYLGALAPAPAGGLTARLLRAPRVGEHRRYADEMMKELSASPFLGAEEAKRLFGIVGAAVTTPKKKKTGAGRPAGRSMLAYAQLADEYAKAWAAGDRKPIVTVAKRLRLTASETSRLVYQSRKRGLLTEITQGIPGGQLTELGRRILGAGRSGR